MSEATSKAACAHKSVEHRPVGGDAMGWVDRWVCVLCGNEFRPVPAIADLDEEGEEVHTEGVGNIGAKL